MPPVAIKIWTDADNARLRELWESDTPRMAIGRELLCSPAAISRQVRALGLAPRLSPLHPRPEAPRSPKPLPAGASTLPPLPSELERSNE